MVKQILKICLVALGITLIFSVTIHGRTLADESGNTDLRAINSLQPETFQVQHRFNIKRDDILTSTLLTNKINFFIEWTLPNNISPKLFVASLTSNSKLVMGTTTIPLTDKNVTISSEANHTIRYTFSDNSVDILTLIKWLLGLNQNSITITTLLESNVASLSNEGFTPDKSIDRIVTKGKLPPSENQILSFTADFYNKNNKKILTNTAEIKTWNTYISPWNQEQAASTLNGKLDDTQMDQSTEVIGINRVLNGSNYADRKIVLPITTTVDPKLFYRTINLYTKQVNTDMNIYHQTSTTADEATQEVLIDQENTSQNTSAKKNRSTLNRTTSILFDSETLSPVPLMITQTTSLTFAIDNLPSQAVVGEQIHLVGQVEADDANIKYSVSIDGTPDVPLENQSVTKNQVMLTLPELTEGTHSLLLKAKNQYTETTIDTPVQVEKEEVYIDSHTTKIDFGTHAIPNVDEIISARSVVQLQIFDNYHSVNRWKVSAKISSPLQTAQYELLPADILLHTVNDQTFMLNDEFETIYQNEELHLGTFSLLDDEMPIYLKMYSSNVKAQTQYNGTVEFLLQTGP